MWEVWRGLERFAIKAPVAWFMEEDTAREYLGYLAAAGVDAELHYNESAVLADYSAPSEWFGVEDRGRRAE